MDIRGQGVLAGENPVVVQLEGVADVAPLAGAAVVDRHVRILAVGVVHILAARLGHVIVDVLLALVVGAGEPVAEGESGRQLQALHQGVEIVRDAQVGLHGPGIGRVETGLGHIAHGVRERGVTAEASVGIVHREGEGGDQGQVVVGVPGTGGRGELVGQAGRQVQVRGQILGDVHVHVAADIVPGELRIGAELALGIRLREEAVVVRDAQHREVPHVPVASLEVEVIVLDRGEPVEDLGAPVHVRIQVGVGPVPVGGDGFVGIERGQSVVGAGLVVQVGVIYRIQELGAVERRVETGLGREAHLHRAFVAALGGDQHHAVGAPHAVDGRGSGVLQDGDGLDFIGRQVVQRGFETVHQDEDAAVGGVERVEAADIDGRTVRARLAASGHDRQARELAVERVHHVLREGLLELFALGDGLRGDIPPGLRHAELAHGKGIASHPLRNLGAGARSKTQRENG